MFDEPAIEVQATRKQEMMTPRRDSAGELLEQVRVILQPAREMYTVIGHGDAHLVTSF